MALAVHTEKTETLAENKDFSSGTHGRRLDAQKPQNLSWHSSSEILQAGPSEVPDVSPAIIQSTVTCKGKDTQTQLLYLFSTSVCDSWLGENHIVAEHRWIGSSLLRGAIGDSHCLLLRGGHHLR